jgi:hypothetical protein
MFTLHVQDVESVDYLADRIASFHEMVSEVMEYDVEHNVFSTEPGYITFIYWQEEVAPETGRLHFQGGFHTSKKVRASGVKKYLTNHGLKSMHFELMRDFEHVYKYCRKEETALAFTQEEHGVKPWETHTLHMEHLALLLRAGLTPDQLALRYPIAHMKYGRQYRETFMARKREEQRTFVRDKSVFEVHVRWGITGAGKTYAITHTYPASDIYRWNYLEKFQKYQGQPVLLLDEFTGQIDYNTLKLMTECEAFEVPVKGGDSVPAQWTKVCTGQSLPQLQVFICSNDPPRGWWTGKVTAGNFAAVQRRWTSETEFLHPFGHPSWGT